MPSQNGTPTSMKDLIGQPNPPHLADHTHLYGSLEAYGHEVFKYLGIVPNARLAFWEADYESRGRDVLTSDVYRGDRVRADLSVYDDRDAQRGYTGLTKRVGLEIKWLVDTGDPAWPKKACFTRPNGMGEMGSLRRMRNGKWRYGTTACEGDTPEAALQAYFDSLRGPQR